MKKILIFYATYGGGHLSAATSIKDFLEANYSDIDITMIDCVKYINKVLNKVTTTAYSEMAKKAPWAWGKVYTKSQEGALSKISTTSNKIMSIKLNSLIKKINPDIIISTHPFSSQMCSHLKEKNELTANIYTIMTDFAPHEQWLIGSKYINGFFVAHSEMKEDLIKKGIISDKIHVTGIPVSNKFLNSFDKKTIFNKYKLSPDKQTILFFAGGEFGLGKNIPFQVLKTICEFFPNIQVIAIAGKNKKIQKNFKDLVNNYNREDSIKVLGYSKEIPELMSISNVIISKPGGLTTSESLLSNVPMLIINPIPGQEEENAEFLEKNHVALWLRKHEDIYTKLNYFLNNKTLIEEMKKNTKKLAKKHSTQNICEIIIKNLNS